MPEITAAMVKQLREATGAGMMDCKRALVDADGDFQRAAELVRERTGAKIGSRVRGRTASEGLVHAYLHTPAPGLPPKVGVLIELNCETDFVAKRDDFLALANDIALHVAAMNPLAIGEQDVDPELLADERRLAEKQAGEEGKSEHIVERIVEGKVKKFFEDTVLLNQRFVKDDSRTVGQLLEEFQRLSGEKVEIGRMARFQVGA